MTKIVGNLDFRQISREQFSEDLHLKVAVVREGQILGSTVLQPTRPKNQPLPFEVEFEAPVLPGSHHPCPVTLIVGPNVADRDLLGLETLTRVVDLEPPSDQNNLENGPDVAREDNPNDFIEVDVGTIAIDPRIYLCWLVCCRTYTIRGRVVCRHWEYDPIEQQWVWCDEPVPGATVEAYDVDRFLVWYKRDLIKSATTAVDGSFEITFTWCCIRWHPWLQPNWTIDPDLLRLVSELLAQTNIEIPPLPPGPDPTIIQHLLGNAASLPGPLLSAAAESGISLPAAPSPMTPLSAEALQAVLPPSPELERLRVWPWWPWPDCAPDVVFRVTQPCDGQTNVIYTESNAQTRWDIPTTLNVTLLANDKACCIPICRDPECPECLKLTWVGCTPVDMVNASAGPPDLRGYAYTGTSLDRPFYGRPRIRGGIGADVDYFKVQYSKDGGPWVDMPVPIFGGFTRRYWDSVGAMFVPASFNPILKSGQTVIATRRHYEDLNFGGVPQIWDDYDTLFYFNTTDLSPPSPPPPLTPDGLYQLRFVGYTADAADNLDLTSERILPTCGLQTDETVYIRLDNQADSHPVPTPLHPCGPGSLHKCVEEPDCYIREVCKNEGQPDEVCISACDIVRLDPNDTLTIHFTATCPPIAKDGHLGGYWMRAEYGVSQVFDIGTGVHGTFQSDPTVEVGPEYDQALTQGAPRPHWYGGDYKVTLKGSDFPECCAYLLRLWAWKRTTNGCSDPSQTHWNQFEMTFTVLRPELCPDICPEVV